MEANERFDRVDQQFEVVGQRLDRVESEFDAMRSDLDKIRILMEEMRSELRLIADVVAHHSQMMKEFSGHLQALLPVPAMLTDFTAFVRRMLENHEGRIRALENRPN